MKLKMFVLFAVALLLVGNAIGGEDKTVLTSSALIAQPMYEFKPVVDGTKVTYDYIIKVIIGIFFVHQIFHILIRGHIIGVVIGFKIANYKILLIATCLVYCTMRPNTSQRNGHTIG